MTGDGRPDLLTAGSANGLASGLWLAAGKNNRGNLHTPATSIASLPTWPAPDFNTLKARPAQPLRP